MKLFLVLGLALLVRAQVEELTETIMVIKLGREIISEVLKTWQLLDSEGIKLPIPILEDKEKKILDRVDSVGTKVDFLSAQVDLALTTLDQIIRDFPAVIRWEIRLDRLSSLLNQVLTMDRTFSSYAREKKQLERHTLEDFANAVVSHEAGSIRNILANIHAMAAPLDRGLDQGVFYLISKTFQEAGSNTCNLEQSPHQVIYNLYNLIAITELKGYAMMQFSWMLLRLYNKGNFTREADLMREKMEHRTMEKATAVKKALETASRELWRCDPRHHEENVTFIQLTELLQGHVQNEVDLNSENTCRENCGYYTYAKVHSCYHNLYCSKQRSCSGRLFNCNYIDSDAWICASQSKHRRYDWIEYENGRVLGQKGSCARGSTKVDSWWRWLFWHCSYCFCLCDEQGPRSDRYFNLHQVTSDIEDNKIVTGLQFVKINRVIHIQIQQGEPLPRGAVNDSTITWKPVDNYRITDSNIYNGDDYHTMTWEQRAMDLDDLKVPEGHVLTGIRFRRLGTHLNPEILATPIDFSTATLNPDGSIWIGNDNTDAALTSPRTPLPLSSADVPTRSHTLSEIDSKSDKFLQFTNTDMYKDAAQTTIPFFDAQPVAPKPSSWLSGASVSHKGSKGYGGFVTLKVLTYDFTNHLMVTFSEPTELDIISDGKN